MSQENMRASDADREVIVGRLRQAMDEGRLNLHEFDDRLQQVYAARTYGELTPLLSDLPAVKNSRLPASGDQAGLAVPTWVKIIWTPWVFVNALCVLIWVATGAGYFWPFWVAVPWGLALFIPTTIGILVGRDNQRNLQERKELGPRDEPRQ
ncbi:DUF1707 domain-containing protein [Nocardia jejuensis]|uniref:DUF1707 domain-containing protein n=1 Tax=Nocardia jejuensis TaxID=328049 RepID=UPI000829A7A6|nr:DUF1707 domain-containing protein [Nocardia jejuensis]